MECSQEIDGIPSHWIGQNGLIEVDARFSNRDSPNLLPSVWVYCAVC